MCGVKFYEYLKIMNVKQSQRTEGALAGRTSGERRVARAQKLLAARTTFCQSNLIAENFNSSVKLFFFIISLKHSPKTTVFIAAVNRICSPQKFASSVLPDNAVERNFYRLISLRYFGF